MSLEFTRLSHSSLITEWTFLLFGGVLCVVAVLGNGYVSHRLLRIINTSRAIQTPIYLSLSLCGLCTGLLCMPYMLSQLYLLRIHEPARSAAIDCESLVHHDESGTAITSAMPETASPPGPTYTTENYTPTTESPGNRSTDECCTDWCTCRSRQVALFDLVMCNFTGAVFNITSRLIIWLMLLLTVDRYIFICKPYRIHRVKKRHYWIWIAVNTAIIVILTLAPFVFWSPVKQEKCPDPPYQPFKPDYPLGYMCTYAAKMESLAENLVFYIFAVILYLTVPIFLNVFFSIIVLCELSKMKRMVSMTQLGENTSRGFGLEKSLRRMSSTFSSKIRGCWIRITRAENKASFTMLVLTIFFVVTYSTWLLIWFSSIPALVNQYRKDPESSYWIYIYYSNSSIAYNIMNHHGFATFANAAFVPCLLGYSLYKSSRN